MITINIDNGGICWEDYHNCEHSPQILKLHFKQLQFFGWVLLSSRTYYKDTYIIDQSHPSVMLKHDVRHILCHCSCIINACWSN